MKSRFATLAKQIDDATAQPSALILAFVIFTTWLACGFGSRWDQSWANAGSNISGWVPFIMVFAIQSAQSRNTRALHLKLDGLIDSIKDANNKLKGIENLPDEAFEEIRGAVCPIE